MTRSNHGPGPVDIAVNEPAESTNLRGAAAAAAVPAVDMGATSHLDEHGNPRIIERRFRVTELYEGHRLDHFMMRQMPRLSRTRLQQIIRGGLEQTTGSPGPRRLKPNTRVAYGDEFVFRYPAKPEPLCPRTFDVLFEDEHMMVIDKPAGLPMHATAKFYFNTLTRVLLERYPDEPLQLAHRIDRETSGCVVLARGKKAAARLKGAFAKKRVRKRYLALVMGAPPWPTESESTGGVVIDQPLGLVPRDSDFVEVRMHVRADGLPSQTRVHVVERRSDRALVACEPITGRQHQIRAHLAHAGFPIAGDKLYLGGDDLFRRCCDDGFEESMLDLLGMRRQALHADTIDVPHPADGARTRICAPLPEDMRTFLDAAG